MMKRFFKVFARIVLVLVCLALVLGIASRSAPTAHADGCTFTDGLGYSDTTLQDGHYLEADFYGVYTPSGRFCGQMFAVAQEHAPAHTTDGWLSIYLYNCGGTLLAYEYIYVPSGGLYGDWESIGTPVVTNISCGKALAEFNGDTVWQVSGYTTVGPRIG